MWGKKKDKSVEQMVVGPTPHTRNVRIFAETGEIIDGSITWTSENEEQGFAKSCNETMLYGAHVSSLNMHVKVKKITWEMEKEN